MLRSMRICTVFTRISWFKIRKMSIRRRYWKVGIKLIIRRLIFRISPGLNRTKLLIRRLLGSFIRIIIMAREKEFL